MPSECKIHCMLRCTSGCCADADLVVESFEVETGPRVFLSIMFSFEPTSVSVSQGCRHAELPLGAFKG